MLLLPQHRASWKRAREERVKQSMEISGAIVPAEMAPNGTIIVKTETCGSLQVSLLCRHGVKTLVTVKYIFRRNV